MASTDAQVQVSTNGPAAAAATRGRGGGSGGGGRRGRGGNQGGRNANNTPADNGATGGGSNNPNRSRRNRRGPRQGAGGGTGANEGDNQKTGPAEDEEEEDLEDDVEVIVANDGTPSSPTRSRNRKVKAVTAALSRATLGDGTSGEGLVGDEDDEDADSGRCFICTEPVKYYAIAACNHPTCHVCAIRLRALYKRMDCVMCKEPLTLVIFTSTADKPFAEFDLSKFPRKDSKLSVYFETEEMMEESLLLLRYNCPDPQCPFIGNGWQDLRLHTRSTHNREICDLCIRFKKVFAHEHVLYPPNVLPIHLPSLHSRQKKRDVKEPPQGGIHPLCEFCRECYFSDDELYAHMREKHEECFVCKRNGAQHVYFQNYESMERHFSTAHHPCAHPECIANKFVVFSTALDLKAHTVEQHGGDMNSRDRRDARRVQAEFAFEDTGRHHGYGHGQGRRDRERERDREPPPPPPLQQQQQQQLRQHHQQQQQLFGPTPAGAAVSTASNNATPAATLNRPGPSRRREAFGTSLTVDASAEGSGPGSGGNSRGASRPTTPPGGGGVTTDVDPQTAERHNAFLARLRSLSAHPDTAMAAVKAAARGYRSNESSSRDFISTVWNVLDRNLEHTASIVNMFVDLLDEEEKKQEMLSSWRGFNVEQRRQFPDLVPAGTGSEYSGITSGRVLNAKHATSSASSHLTSQRVWERVARAASSSAPLAPPSSSAARAGSSRDAFPSLPTSTTTTTPFRQGQRNTPWASSSAAFRPATSSASAAAVPTSSASAFPSLSSKPVSVHNPTSKTPFVKQGPRQPVPKVNAASFPELPTSSATRIKPVISGNSSLKNILGTTAPTASAWGGGGSSSGGGAKAESGNGPSGPVVDNADGSGGSVEGVLEEQGVSKGKKAKGKQKQMLFTLGSFPT